MSEIDDGGPAYPEPFIYMVNSMATEKDLEVMARQFSDRAKELSKGMSFRDHLVAQALTGASGRCVSRRETNGTTSCYFDSGLISASVDAAEMLADEYLRRRAWREGNGSGLQDEALERARIALRFYAEGSGGFAIKGPQIALEALARIEEITSPAKAAADE